MTAPDERHIRLSVRVDSREERAALEDRWLELAETAGH